MEPAFRPLAHRPRHPDPSLTPEGVAEARAAAAQLVDAGISRILTSPYRRALQTAGILAEAIGAPIAIEPLVRERRAFSCDEGSSPARLAQEWPHLDFSGVEDLWWGPMIESHPSLEARMRRFLVKARSMPDPTSVAIVTHWGFIRCATGREVGNLGTVRLELDRSVPAPPA